MSIPMKDHPKAEAHKLTTLVALYSCKKHLLSHCERQVQHTRLRLYKANRGARESAAVVDVKPAECLRQKD